MAYTNTVNLLSLEGGAWPPVTARLWMLWTVVGSGSGTGPQQLEQGTDSPMPGSTFSFSFALGPDFSGVGKSIGVSLQDTARVGSDTGWWFRSGRFSGPLPTGPIEVVLLSPLGLTRADFAAALPPLPIAMSLARTITFISVISGTSLVVLIVSGTTTEMPGVPVSFTYRLELSLVPSPSIGGPSELFVLGVSDPGLLTFFAVPPNSIGAAAAATLNALGLAPAFRDFAVNSILPGVISGLERRLEAIAVTTGLAGLIGPGASSLPAGVILSVRSVEATPSGLTVRSALGAFGGVFSKFPPPPAGGTPGSGTPGRRTCFIAAAATSEDAPEVHALRAFRDSCLLPSRQGARLVRLYETCSPPLARQVRRHRLLRLAVRHMIVRPAALLARIVTNRRDQTDQTSK